MADRTVLDDEVTIMLPWSRLPLSLNDRRAWQQQHRDMTKTITEARWAIRSEHLPRLTGAKVVLTMLMRDARARDTDNMAMTLKACLDALVDEGVLPGDTWRTVPFTGLSMRYQPSLKESQFLLRLLPIGGLG